MTETPKKKPKTPAKKTPSKSAAKTTTAKSKTSTARASAEKQDTPDVLMFPPALFLLFLMGGIVLDWLIPMNWGHGWGGLGLVIFGAAIGIILWCRKLFENAQTNISPLEPSNALVTEGPFSYSRNPIYVCFIAGYIGLAMMADAPVMLLLAGGLWYMLDKYIIEPEEEYLTEKFGEQYLDYTTLTRRWL